MPNALPHRRWNAALRCAATLALLLVLTACAAGPGSEWAKPDAEPAGFFAGFWHGLLLVITLIVSFFTDQVGIYEVHNVGTAYNVGFVLGTLAAYGSGIRITTSRRRAPAKAADVDRIAGEVERRVTQKIQGILDDEEWQDLGDRVEQRVKAKLRRWLDDER